MKLPDELLGGAVKVILPTDLRNRVGMYMMEERGVKMGRNVDPGDVQDMIEEFTQREIVRIESGSASTAGPRPNDKLYVVEHKRDGVWRLHLDMNILTIEAQSILAMQELRRQWPAAEWRVASYVPAQSVNTGPRPRCPKCGYADGLPLYPPTEIQPNIEVACPRCGLSVMPKVDERGYVDLEAFAQFFAAAPAEDGKEK